MGLVIGEREQRSDAIEEYAVRDESGQTVGAVYRHPKEEEWNFVLHLGFRARKSQEQTLESMAQALATYRAGLEVETAAHMAGWTEPDGSVNLSGFIRTAVNCAKRNS
jgi:hypothetical protein